MVQDIPSPAVVYSKELHNMTLKGKWDVDWGKKHEEHISYWDSRLDHGLLLIILVLGSLMAMIYGIVILPVLIIHAWLLRDRIW